MINLEYLKSEDEITEILYRFRDHYRLVEYPDLFVRYDKKLRMREKKLPRDFDITIDDNWNIHLRPCSKLPRNEDTIEEKKGFMERFRDWLYKKVNGEE